MIKLLLLLTLSLTIIRCSAQKGTQLNMQLNELTQLFVGEFDNFAQNYKEKEDKATEIHEHIHSIFYPISIPWLGSHVVYVLQYLDGDSSKIYRQRIYNFVPDAVEKAVRLDIYTLKTDSLYYYAHLQPNKLANLSSNDIQSTAGCAVYWVKQGADYIGYMKPQACNFVSKRSGKKINITDSLKLNGKELWIRDEAADEQGNYVFGNKQKIAHKLKRCTYYKGWLLLQKAGLDNEYHTNRNLTWHDQGQRQKLYTDDNKPTKYEIELATVTYSSGLEVLKLGLYEVGISKAIAYTWASPGSNNIGINMRWLQAGLTKVQ